jgi:hypothetical protein
MIINRLHCSFIVDYPIGPLGFSELMVLLFVPGPFVAGIGRDLV